MKLINAFVFAFSATSLAWSISKPVQYVLDAGVEEDSYLIELSPGETKWIKEHEKWSLRRVGPVACLFN